MNLASEDGRHLSGQLIEKEDSSGCFFRQRSPLRYVLTSSGELKRGLKTGNFKAS
jgi:hypothetical protein